MSEEYSNQTLGVMIDRVEQKLENGFKGVHKRQDTTNGRVRNLEKWKYTVVGGFVVISIIITGLLIPLTLDYLRDKQISEEELNKLIKDINGE